MPSILLNLSIMFFKKLLVTTEYCSQWQAITIIHYPRLDVSDAALPMQLSTAEVSEIVCHEAGLCQQCLQGG